MLTSGNAGLALSSASTSKPKPLPARLAHYTTLPGLTGIVSTSKLWASNVSFLNDNRELIHGVDASVAAIKMLTKKAQNEHWNEPLRDVATRLRENKIPYTYAACFCAKTDSLSQWRGYGGGVQGVAVVFGRQALEILLKKQKAKLYRVIYCDLSAQKRMREAVEKELGDLDEINELLGATTPKEQLKDAYTAICRLLPQFKHWGFRDEDELRFVVQQTKLTDSVKFRANGNLLVPYLELGSGEQTSLPIAEVVIGPGRHQELTAQGVRQFLTRHGYEHVDVTLSKVPFRT